MALQLESQHRSRYRVLHRLAAGGMAEIYLAERIHGGEARLVALKRLLPHLLGDSMILGMLADEIALGARCVHPNLVGMLDAGHADGQPFAVMEYVDGLDLRSLTRFLAGEGRQLGRAAALRIAMDLCQGLRHMHGLRDDAGDPLGVVHRDVTPPNVLIGLDGSVKLCDFGLCKSRLQRTLTEPGLIKGKFSYLSPEVALGAPVDARTDVFAVGILLWEMLTMQRLFHADTDYDTVQQVIATDIPPLEPGQSDEDGVLDQIVRKALAHDPAERFQSAEALYNALAAYADWQELDCDLAPLVARARRGRELSDLVRPTRPPPPPLPRARPVG